jgi:hypothetical protein
MFSKDFKILQTHDFFFSIMKNNIFAFDMGVNITIIQQMMQPDFTVMKSFYNFFIFCFNLLHQNAQNIGK